MNGYTLDTNTIIYFLKEDRRAVTSLEHLFNHPLPLYISTITEAELFSFSALTSNEFEAINNLLLTLAIIPVDSRLARTAGTLRQRYTIELPDSLIAATALFTNTTLLTRNLKDFVKITELTTVAI